MRLSDVPVIDMHAWGVQRSLRQYFGIPTPAAEHRAMDDVGVLSALVQPLLAASAAPSLQHLMAAALSNGVAGTYAGRVSHVLLGKGQGAHLRGLWLSMTELAQDGNLCGRHA